MPLCLSSVIVRVTLDMAGIILTAAGLGFLGLGAQPPLPEWGAMIAAGRRFLLDQWWVATMPGIAIFIVSLGFNLLGDGLRDVLDPKAAKHEPHSAARRRGPARHLPDPARARPRRCAASPSRSGASGSASSANAAPASRQTGRAILGLTPPPGEVDGDRRLTFDGIDLLARLRARPGGGCAARRISMVMQDPKFSLNPVMTVGEQIARGLSSAPTRPAEAEAARQALAMLEAVQIRDPERVFAPIRTRCPAAWASAS